MVLEKFEEEKGTPQKFPDLVDKLKSSFNTTASCESKMALFEVCTQQLGETEEEFMLELVTLYRASNPGVYGGQFEMAVK